jgi:hypothetical protein
VSAAIIQFIPRPRRRGGPNDAIASFFGRTISPWIMPIRAPCEYVWLLRGTMGGERRPDRKELR